MFDFIIERLHALDFDVVALVVIDVIEGAVDFLDALPDDVSISQELGLENRHVLDGILPQPLLELRQQLGQVVFLDSPIELFVFIAVRRVQLVGEVRVALIVLSEVIEILRHAGGHGAAMAFFLRDAAIFFSGNPAIVFVLLVVHGLQREETALSNELLTMGFQEREAFPLHMG